MNRQIPVLIPDQAPVGVTILTDMLHLLGMKAGRIIAVAYGFTKPRLLLKDIVNNDNSR
jgi:hypothetical protein